MGFVAIKGGEEAIKNSLAFYEEKIQSVDKSEARVIENSLKFAVDKVISEGSLYSKKLSSVAIAKAGGDLLNASFFLRAHRSSCARVGIAKTIHTDKMRVVRRISSAFKDIKGGQILGPSNDYEVKLILKQAIDKTVWDDYKNDDIFVESALKPLRDAGMIKTLSKDEKTSDITRVFPSAPYPRSAVMQIMARGESGSMLAFAYTSMRGYGDVHPTIGDLRLGSCEVKFTHPFTKNEVKIGEIDITACEAAATFEKQSDGSTKLTTGFGCCFGFNETKAISMSILDTTLYNKSHTIGQGGIADNFEMIVHHIDGIESMGFTNHYKLPHYVTFQADLQVYENAKKYSAKEEKK
jgi:alpha-D-ribose 1-methylphosphonate 5-triphosphate synthase subunit PhnI